MNTLVSFRFPLFRNANLAVARAPLFLRFVTAKRGQRTFDALDQLDDTVADDEVVFAAERKSTGSVHVDRTVNGKRVGEWYQTADYELIREQPTEATMRDNDLWRAWCVELLEQRKFTGSANAATGPVASNAATGQQPPN